MSPITLIGEGDRGRAFKYLLTLKPTFIFSNLYSYSNQHTVPHIV